MLYASGYSITHLHKTNGAAWYAPRLTNGLSFCANKRIVCTGTTTGPVGNKHHIGALEHFVNFVFALFDRFAADFLTAAGP